MRFHFQEGARTHRGDVQKTARQLLAAVLLGCPAGWLAGCAPSSGSPAGRCAEVARLYADLQPGVTVIGRPVETSGGTIEIEYEGMDGMNLPVRGAASCTFAAGELVAAVVDGSALDAGEVESIRSQLGHAR